MSAGLRVDLIVKPRAVSWRMWKGSRIIGASSESYVKQSAAIRNLETVAGGAFEKISTPDFAEPYGLLHRHVAPDLEPTEWQAIPVRLVEP